MICAFLICFMLAFHSSAEQTSQLEGRIHPLKHDYILGEPIFLEIELINNAKQPVAIDTGIGACSVPDKTEVVGATHRTPTYWPRSCCGGSAGSCGSGNSVLKPGEKLVRQILLSRTFSFDHPGAYRVKARNLIPIYADERSTTRNRFFEVASDFDINVFQGTEAQLKAEFTPYIEELPTAEADPEFGNMQNSLAQINAVNAITTMAPPFLEEMIIRLLEIPVWVGKTIPALGSLNTEHKEETGRVSGKPGRVQTVCDGEPL